MYECPCCFGDIDIHDFALDTNVWITCPHCGEEVDWTTLTVDYEDDEEEE